jgi:hypothetical protein
MGSSNGFAATLQIKDGEVTMTAARQGEAVAKLE